MHGTFSHSDLMGELPGYTKSNSVEKHGIENRGFLDLREVIKIIDPIRVKGPAEGPLSGVAIDTRKPMGEDHIFWAIKGSHFNGNDFAEQALSKGVKAVVVNREDLFTKPVSSSATIIQVADTLTAIQKLAANYRNGFTCPVVGVTGSNGKTLVKEMLASILSLERTIYRSPLSYNTQVGAALGLFGMRPEHEVAIIEAGISRPGEMDRLESMIRPNHGILTVISKAHIGGLRDLTNTLKEKQKLFRRLVNPSSFLVLNADDELSMTLAGILLPFFRAAFATHDLSGAGLAGDTNPLLVAGTECGAGLRVDYVDEGSANQIEVLRGNTNLPPDSRLKRLG